MEVKKIVNSRFLDREGYAIESECYILNNSDILTNYFQNGFMILEWIKQYLYLDKALSMAMCASVLACADVGTSTLLSRGRACKFARRIMSVDAPQREAPST